MTKSELSSSIRLNMVSSRSNLNEAFADSSRLIEGLPAEYRVAAYTALYLILNTVANEIDQLE